MRFRSTLLLALLLIGCSSDPARLDGIPLQWRPTTPISDFGSIDVDKLLAVKLQFEKFTDKRSNPALIAENHEDVQARTVTTRDDVGRFVSDNMRDTLRAYGLDVVDADGQVLVSGEVSNFFVLEGNTYDADVLLRVTVHDRAGKTLWSGLARGHATRFGHSYRAENYYEVLSDSVLDATFDLLGNPDFRAALAHA